MRSKFWPWSGLLAVLALVILPAGCKKQSPAAKPGAGAGLGHVYPPGTRLKLAFISNNVANYWNFAHAGIRAFEKKTGRHITFREPSKGTVAEQNQIIEDLVAEGYNGIAVSVIAPNDQVRTLDSAARHLNLICVDSDAPKAHRLMYIGTQNFHAGLLMGREIVKLLPEGGQMAVFVGTFSADNARQRLNGIKKAIAGHHITIVAKKEDNKDYALARTNAENVISAYPQVRLLCGLWSYNGALIAAAVKAAGKAGKIKIVAFDQDPDTLADIQSGLISATVVQNPFKEGFLSCRWLQKICRHGGKVIPLSKKVDTGVSVVDQSNLAAYQKKLAAMMAAQ